MTDKIKMKLVETNVLTRWPCDVCGGCTEKVSILCESDNCLRPRVCEFCLKNADADGSYIDGTLRRWAERLEQQPKYNKQQVKDDKQQAAYVRSLIGRLELPSYAEWEAAEAAVVERASSALL
jgi:hypothetical protein